MSCSLIWFDPGSTTGMVVIVVRPAWLAGGGPPGWDGLAKAIRSKWAGQAGREPRSWEGDKAVRKAPMGRIGIAGRKPRAGSPKPSDKRAELLDNIAQCEALLDQWPSAAWGSEDFTLRTQSRTFDTLAPLRVMEALIYAERAYGERSRLPYLQLSSQALTTVDDEAARRCGLYFPGMPHATVAAKHAMTFLRKARQSEQLRASAWPSEFKIKPPTLAAAG